MRNQRVVEMIGSKKAYSKDENSSQDDESVGGIRLDEKTLLEEAFINFHDFLRKYRLKIMAKFSHHEMNTRTPLLVVNMKMNMSDQVYDNLRKKRSLAWRGFIRRVDMHLVLKNIGFFETVSPKIFDVFIERVKCLNKEKDWVNYILLIACMTRYKSSISHLTKKFLTIDLKNGSKRVRSFRKYDEKQAVDAIVV